MNISPSQSPHVINVVIDYFEGRLPGSKRTEVDEHLAACDECRVDFEFAASLRANTVGRGIRHIHPDRLVRLAESDPDTVTLEERSHLADCDTCSKEYSFLQELPVAPELSEETVDEPSSLPAASVDSRGWLDRVSGMLSQPWGIGAAMAAAAVVLVLISPWDRAPDLSGLVDREPLPVNIHRGPVDPQSFDGLRVQGLGAYDDADYSRAAELFLRASALQVDNAEIQLYLGSAQLLSDDAQAAADALTKASGSADPLIREMGLWLLANARVAQGKPDAAKGVLGQIIELDGDYVGEAQELLKKLDR